MRYLLCSFSVWIVLFLLSATALHCQQPDIVWQTTLSTTAVTHLEFSQDGGRLAVKFAGQDSLIYIINGASGEHIATCEIPLPAADEIDHPSRFIFSPDGRYLYFAVRVADWSYPTQIRVKKWSVATGSIAATFSVYANDNLEEHDVFGNLQLFSFAHSSLIGIAVDTEMFGIRSSGRSGMLYLIDMEKDNVFRKYETGELGNAVISAGGSVLAYNYWSSYTYRNPGSGEEHHSENSGTVVVDIQQDKNWHLPKEILSVRAATPEESYIIIRRNDSLLFWDFRHGTLAGSLPRFLLHAQWSFFTTMDYLFAPGYSGHTVGIYNRLTETWDYLLDIPNVFVLTLQPGDQTFATGSPNGQVTLWKILGSFVRAPVQADFSVSDTEPEPGHPVSFRNHSFPVLKETRYYWDFGDGTTSTEFAPSHTYTRPGFFTVQLIVENSATEHDTIRREQYISVAAISNMAIWSSRQTDSRIRSISYSSNGRKIAAAHYAFSLFDADSGMLIDQRQNGAMYVAPAADNDFVYTHSDVNTFPLVEITSLNYASSTTKRDSVMYKKGIVIEVPRPPDAHTYTIGSEHSLASSPEGSVIVLGSHVEFGYVAAKDSGMYNVGLLTIHNRRLDTVYWSQSAAIIPRPTFIRAVAPDGSWLVSSELTTWGARTYLRDVYTLQAIDSLPFACSVTAICPTDTRIVICDSVLWHRRTGETLPLMLRKPVDMQFTADGRYLIAVYTDEDSTAAIFDIQENRYVLWYLRHPSRQNCIDIAPNGRHFATGAEDGSVTVWNIPEEFWPGAVAVPSNTQNNPSYIIGRVSPNPADATGCTLLLSVKQPSHIDVVVSDIYGRKVAEPFSGMLEPGQYPMYWNARTHDGTTVANGVYYCIVQVNGMRSSIPIIIQR